MTVLKVEDYIKGMQTSTNTFFGKQLTRRIGELGLSKYRVAKQSGLSTTHIGNLTLGHRAPTDDAIAKLAPVLGLDAEALRAWVHLDKLGADGIRGIRDHVLPEFDAHAEKVRHVVKICNRMLTATQDEIEEILADLTRILDVVGIGTWNWHGPEAGLRMDYGAGLHPEYLKYSKLAHVHPHYVSYCLDVASNPEMGELTPPVYASYLGQRDVLIDKISLGTCPPLAVVAKAAGYDAVFVTPISQDSRKIGVLAVYANSLDFFERQEGLEIIRLFCGVLATRPLFPALNVGEGQ